MDPKGKAIIFSAPSGAGKTTIVHALLERGLPMEFSISACSREKRGEETDGKDYYFLGVEGFKSCIANGAFLEWEEVYPGQFYGTLNSEIQRIADAGKAVIFDVDVVGGLNLKKMLGKKALSIFVNPPSIHALRNRLEARNTESSEKIDMRMAKARKEMEFASRFDVVIENKDLETAIGEAYNTVEKFLKQ